MSVQPTPPAVRSPRLVATIVTVPLVGLVLAATACGGSPAVTPGSLTGKTTPPATMSAEQVVQGLVARVPTARTAAVYTAQTDPNHLLGRPGGYTGKASVTDTRVETQTPGSSVEVFGATADAQTRGQYIQRLTRAVHLLGSEYTYDAGPVLLRLTGALLPAQAEEYRVALAAVTGTAAEAVEVSS